MSRPISTSSMSGRIYFALDQAKDGDTLTFTPKDAKDAENIGNIVRVVSARYREHNELTAEQMNARSLKPEHRYTLEANLNRHQAQSLKTFMNNLAGEKWIGNYDVKPAPKMRYKVTKK